MAIDDSFIDSSVITLNNTLKEIRLKTESVEQLRSCFTSIQKTKKRVINQTGGYDVVTEIPNKNNLSDIDVEKLRTILYDDAKTKFEALKL